MIVGVAEKVDHNYLLFDKIRTLGLMFKLRHKKAVVPIFVGI